MRLLQLTAEAATLRLEIFEYFPPRNSANMRNLNVEQKPMCKEEFFGIGYDEIFFNYVKNFQKIFNHFQFIVSNRGIVLKNSP